MEKKERWKFCYVAALLIVGVLRDGVTSVYAGSKHSYEQQAEQIMQQTLLELKRADKIFANISRFKKAYNLLVHAEKQTQSLSARITEKQGKIWCFIGRLYRQQKEWSQAYQAYHRCIPLLIHPQFKRVFSQEKESVFAEIRSHIQVQSVPSGVEVSVFDDYGEKHLVRTPFKLAVAPGMLVIHAKHPGYRIDQRKISIQPKMSQIVRISLEKELPIPVAATHTKHNVVRIAAWSHIALAAATLGTGLTFLSISQNNFSDATRMRNALLDNTSLHNTDLYKQVNESFQPERRKHAEDQQTASIVFLSVAAVSLGVAVGLFIWNRNKSPSPSQLSSSSKSFLSPTNHSCHFYDHEYSFFYQVQ